MLQNHAVNFFLVHYMKFLNISLKKIHVFENNKTIIYGERCEQDQSSSVMACRAIIKENKLTKVQLML